MPHSSFYPKIVSHQQYPSKHTCTHSAKNTMLTQVVPLWICVTSGLLTDISHNCTCPQCKDKCKYKLNTVNMPQCRDPVAHKICTRKLNGYLFVLKTIVSEKWSLEKSLSGLIRRVIQLPSSAFFSISVVKCFQDRLPKIRRFQHELTVNIKV